MSDPSVATTPAQRETSPTRPYTGQHPQDASGAQPVTGAGQEFSSQVRVVPVDGAAAGEASGALPDAGSVAPGQSPVRPAGRAARRRARQRKPGPPPKVAVPMLLVALLCFAVGSWALIQS